jgi:amidase
LYFGDGGAENFQIFRESGEPILPLTDYFINDVSPGLKEHTIRSLWDATIQREMYRAAYQSKWNATGSLSPAGDLKGAVDVILCPAGPSVAPKLETARYWGYTSVWNLLDYPAAVFPVSKVSAVDNVQPLHEPRNEKDKFNWELWEKHGAAGYDAAPIGLQLVGKRFQDEKLLHALEIIVEEMGLAPI